MMRRRRGPGLIGTMARTAVIAGTATATVGAIQGHNQKKAAQAQAAQDAIYNQGVADAQAAAAAAAAPPPPPVAAPAPAPAGGTDLMTELQKLADLKAAGVLTDEEFAAAKAKLLG